MRIFIVLLVVSPFLVFQCLAFRHRTLELEHSDYTAEVFEDLLIVEDVRPAKISVNTKDNEGILICSYRLQHRGNASVDDDVPFELKIDNARSGAASLELKQGSEIDCESRQFYHLSITAIRCPDPEDESDVVESEPSSLTIKIKDRNEHAPEFEQHWVNVTVDEGRVYQEIVKIQAIDRDCTSRIKKYEITNNAEPFVIDVNGVLRNEKPLKYDDAKVHVLTVSAEDTGSLKSVKEMTIMVNVRKSCVKELDLGTDSDTIEYGANTGPKYLWPNARIAGCESTDEELPGCSKVHSVTTDIKMHAEHIKRGCDRGAIGAQQLMQDCGAMGPADSFVNLLPSKPGSPDGDEVVRFEGKADSVMALSSSTLNPVLPSNFSLNFWMKHPKQQRIRKEQHKKHAILCSMEKEERNQQHFNLFVRRCKLELIFRQEFVSEEERHIYRPTEWRWEAPEVCDGKWHQYNVNMQYPDAHLFIDGVRFDQNKEFTEILDDHTLSKHKFDGVVHVGGCWHGREQQLVEFFTGYLSSMTIQLGDVQHPSVIQCLHNCKEGLYGEDLTQMTNGMALLENSNRTHLRLSAKSVEDMITMLRLVKYHNRLAKPTLGFRTLNLKTSATCENNERKVQLHEVTNVLVVKENVSTKVAPLKTLMPAEMVTTMEPKLHITLSGNRDITVNHMDLPNGVNIFADIDIESLDQENNTLDNVLQYCKISTSFTMDESEMFSSSVDTMQELGLDFQHLHNDRVLKGLRKAADYVTVLKTVRFVCLKPEITPKKFTLTCYGTQDEASNDLEITVKSAPSEHEAVNPPQPVKADDKPVHVSHMERSQFSGGLSGMHYVSKDDGQVGVVASSSGNIVAIVVVVCVCMMLLLVVFGVLKLRSSGKGRLQRRRAPSDGLAWDDSALNITVNPLEQPTHQTHLQDNLPYDSSSDDDSYRDDEDCFTDEDEDDDSVLPHVDGKVVTGLEWDDSTLNAPMAHHGRTSIQTYRV